MNMAEAMRIPGGGVYVVQGEMNVLLTAMRRATRWSAHNHQVPSFRHSSSMRVKEYSKGTRGDASAPMLRNRHFREDRKSYLFLTSITKNEE